MAETYRVLETERYDDGTFLRASGLIVKDVEGQRRVKVLAEQYDMAERFLKGRRLSENLRNIRRDKQKQIDRQEYFDSLGE